MPQTELTVGTSGAEPSAPVEGTEMLSFPATLAQEAFWYLDQLSPGNTAFNVAVRFHLAGPLDVRLLEESFNEILRRHEVLRCRLEQHEEGLKQVVLPDLRITLAVIDLSHLSEQERRVEMDRQGSLEAHRPFRLSEAPLVRANLLRLAPQEHMLQVTVHHAISDGWSIGLITDELAAIYNALANGEPCPLPELPIQFPDFTIWQRQFLEGPEIAAQLAYWKRRLAGFGEPGITTDFPRPPVKRWHGEIVSILLPVEVTNQIQRLCQSHGATLFMALLAAFKVLLLRYTGQTDIAIGSPVVGRTRVEVEKLVGVFINTVVLRTDLSGNPSFTDLLHRIRETVIEAMANQDLPFEMLVNQLHPNRDLSRNPLVQINFIHQRDFVKPVKFGGLTLTAVPSRSTGAIFDLQFFMVERDGVWRASCEYDTDLFERSTPLRMLGHFQQLLRSIAANPETPIEQLELLPPEERQRILVEWNNTRRDYPDNESIAGLFEAQARQNPSKVAVRYGKASMNYAELDRAADVLAAWLRSLGARPGVLVGLCMDRNLDMVVGLLGILKSGAAYVPMDPAFPAERLGYMIDDARMSLIVTVSKLTSCLPPHQAQLVMLDDPVTDDGPAPDGPRVQAHDLAYVIFTSGSTGRPKGVEISHRAVVNFLNSMRREPGLTLQDVLLSVTTLSFDIFGLELFLPLTTGACVVLASREIASDARMLMAELERTGTTVMQATPITWRMLLDSGWEGSPKLKGLVGGEAVPRELINRLRPRCASLWNMYGPTETTIWSTTERLEVEDGVVSIGRPIDNTQVYVVSPRMLLQPVGVPGELVIGGDGLARGYLNRPEFTAEKFVVDPFSGRDGSRLYRTGDLARWREDGSLECLQRMDQQVKIRGFRIELGEIEGVLARHPGIRQNVVTLWEDSPGDKRLVSYLVPAAGHRPGAIELRKHLRLKLPDYMIPSAFVLMDQLPLTPNGKINRKALPAPDTTLAPSNPGAAISPRNPTEQRLAEVFSALLHSECRSIHDDFFDLGGHSLLAVRLMSQIEREFGVRLPLAALFNAPTVARLADRLTSKKSQMKQWDSLVPIRPSEGKPVLYLVHGAGGNVLLYRELANALSPEVATYGFQSQGLDHQEHLLTTVEQMADRYVSELRKFQPSGPYHLGGYCLGGTIAYEMARLLHDEGEVVRLVALLDTYNFSRALPASGWRFFCQKAGFHARNLAALRPTEAVRYVAEKLRILREGELTPHLATRKLRTRTKSGPQIELTVQQVNDAAASEFRPQPYPGRLTVIKPSVNYDMYPDPMMGWGGLAVGGVDMVELSVYPHAMLVKPSVIQLAEQLKTRMEI